LKLKVLYFFVNVVSHSHIMLAVVAVAEYF